MTMRATGENPATFAPRVLMMDAWVRGHEPHSIDDQVPSPSSGA